MGCGGCSEVRFPVWKEQIGPVEMALVWVLKGGKNFMGQ